MTAYKQDFAVTADDDEIITFCIVGPNDQPLDLSAVSDIEWSVRFDANNLLTKSMSANQITLGALGQFIVPLQKVDTAPWLGLFPHQAVLIDDVGNRSTVSNGTMTVAPRIAP